MARSLTSVGADRSGPAGRDPAPAAARPNVESALTDAGLDWALDAAPYWPITRLISWSLTVLLAVELVVPLALDSPRGMRWPAVLSLSVFATLVVRGAYGMLSTALGHRGPAPRLAAATFASALGSASVLAGCILFGAGASQLGSAAIASAVLVTATLLIAGGAREVEIKLRRSLRRVFFAGASESMRDLGRELSRRPDARIVGALGTGIRLTEERVITSVMQSDATVLVLDGEAMRMPEVVAAAAKLNLAGIRVRDLVSYYESEFKKVPLSEISPAWFLFDITSIHHRRAYRAFRRGLDVFAAALILIVTFPALVLAGVVISLTSSGPVIYRQRRVGKDGREFELLKLRTMRQREGEAATWAGSERHRVTAVGALLRRFRFDEVPQLWNVIRGDLAVIGPRPEQVPIVARLGREVSHYDARHCIRPGITGWAQVNLGYAGSIDGAVAKLQRDLYYVKHSCLRLDGLIVWLTLKAILMGPEPNARLFARRGSTTTLA
jgi:lipopolysaccharide/colanic/teichoic acid biosynthesis glycosyltransferase